MSLSFFVLTFVAGNQVFSQTPIAYFDPQNNPNSSSQFTIDVLYSDGSSGVFCNGPFSDYLTGMAVDNSGNLYVAGYNSGNIFKVTQAGVISTFATGVFDYEGLAFDAAGNLYAGVANGIDKITPGGVVSTFVSGSEFGQSPNRLAFDNSGNLYVAAGLQNPYGDTTILKITPSDTVSTFASGLVGASGLAFDTSGNLYVSEAAQFGPWDIKKIDPQGNVSTFSSGGGLTEPSGLFFDNSGNLWVADWGTEISEIAPGGSIQNYSAPYCPDNFAPYVVPEPATWSLLVLGISAVVGGRILRRRSS